MSDEKKKESGSKSPPPAKKTEAYRIPAGSGWSNAWKIFGGVGVVCLVGAGAMSGSDPRRFAFSYLFAFATFLAIALGSLFFVLYQRLTVAGWSVTVRRPAEFLASGLVVFAVLVAPIIVGMNHLYPWLGGAHGGEHPASPEQHHSSVTDGIIPEAHAQDHAAGQGGQAHDTGGGHGMGTGGGHGAGQGAEHGAKPHPAATLEGVPGFKGPATQEEATEQANHLAHEKVLAKKSPYLNANAFRIRAVLYVIIWAFLAFRLLGYSTDQDKSKDPKLTLAAQKFSAPAVILFALSLTFAAFDWIMSLEPSWFSTIFGVNFFASAVVSSHAVLILVAMSMRESGLVKNEINVEHFHDLGKLTFGFLVFWAYISFSQLMLIWYAALPEEVTFYHHRWDVEPFHTLSLLLIVGHFIMPFFGIMSRNFKRRLAILRFWVVWILAMHVVQMYWFVMPYYSEHFTPNYLMDPLCLLGVGGIYFGFVFWQMTKHAIIPVGDPRLQRALKFENA